MIGVEGTDAVVLGGNVKSVVRALSGDFDVGSLPGAFQPTVPR